MWTVISYLYYINYKFLLGLEVVSLRTTKHCSINWPEQDKNHIKEFKIHKNTNNFITVFDTYIVLYV